MAQGSFKRSNSRTNRTVANIVSLPSLTCWACFSDKTSAGRPMGKSRVRIWEFLSLAMQKVVHGV